MNEREEVEAKSKTVNSIYTDDRSLVLEVYAYEVLYLSRLQDIEVISNQPRCFGHLSDKKGQES